MNKQLFLLLPWSLLCSLRNFIWADLTGTGRSQVDGAFGASGAAFQEH